MARYKYLKVDIEEEKKAICQNIKDYEAIIASTPSEESLQLVWYENVVKSLKIRLKKLENNKTGLVKIALTKTK